MPPPEAPSPPLVNHQCGAALMLLLLLVSVGALAVFVTGLNRATQQLERDRITTAALAQAKEALIGWAATYRDNSHPNEIFGYLPCPDADNDGFAEPSCDSKDVSVIGRLPWKTLGLPPLRDGAGECLWYAVSGHAKNNPKTDELNWDAIGQFEIRDAANVILAAAGNHNTPWAVILAPRATINGQTRAASASECGGSNASADYLEGTAVSAIADANSTITLGTAASALAGTNNDQGQWITAQEIYNRIKKRSDFKGDIIKNIKGDIDFLVGDMADCLNTLSKLPDVSANNKGVDGLLGDSNVTNCLGNDQKKTNVRNNWKNNMLYAKLHSVSTVNGEAGCSAVLFFGGERIAGQSRVTTTEKNLVTNYLENVNATFDPSIQNRGAYSGSTDFRSSATNSADVVRCIKLAGAVQASFTNNFSKFVATGTLVSDVNGVKTYSTGVTTNTTDKTLTIGGAPGTAGGCFWYPDAITLAGKTLRAYYDYQFSTADTYALTGAGSDRGNGFTFQMVRSDLNPPPLNSPPTVCGLEADMGALASGNVWASSSFIIETDVHKDAADTDPDENHTAIMYGGNLNHSLTNGNPTPACNGIAAGCRHNPANKFEESPSPLPHNQRIEIHTGCDSSCSNCVPANHVAPNTYARIRTWVDCMHCDDVSAADLFDPEFIVTTEDRDFSASGHWIGTNWQVAGGVLSHVMAGANAVSLPNSALFSPPVAGAAYQVAITVKTTVPGKLVIAFGGTSSSTVDFMVGTQTLSLVQIATTLVGALTLTPDAAWMGSIDNVSITPVTPPVGAELIKATENRDFSVPGNWVGTNWVVAGEMLNHTMVGANAASLPNSELTSTPVSGAIYQVTVTVATTMPGQLIITFGGKSAAAIDLVAGAPATYTVRLPATSAGALTLTPDAAWVGTIDNVSVARLRPYLPTIERCIDLETKMNSIYFGFTGGFRSSVNTLQGATFRNFYLRSE